MMTGATAQAGSVTYEFHTLGWKAFQDLCLAAARELMGPCVEAFASSRDGGRDGAFEGEWASAAGVSGRTTIQCKFSARRDRGIALGDLADELLKAKRLASSGHARNYVLMVSHSVSGIAAEEIGTAFRAVPGLEYFLLIGAQTLTQLIQTYPRLRTLVPRVYGLGDLSQILDERRYAQAAAVLDTMREDLNKVVPTGAYHRSIEALHEHRFVLLLGEPGAGKSTIASMLAVGAIDMFGCRPIRVERARDFIQHWNSQDPKQLFWVDDAFGATQYAPGAAFEWVRAYPYVKAAIGAGACVLLTSRIHIYTAARPDLKMGEFPLMTSSQVVIKVERLTAEEREQIVYNHVKLGDQPKSFRTGLKPLLPFVAHSDRFLPETARRLGNTQFTQALSVTEDAIKRFVEQPVAYLIEVLEGLNTHCQAALGLLFMNGGSVASPLSLTPEENRAIDIMGSDSSRIRGALSEMDGSFVRCVRGPQQEWVLQHPTIRDAIASLTANDPEKRDIYLAGTPTEQLLSEVSCGDVGAKGVKVIVPPDLYGDILQRLNTYDSVEAVCRFLVYRCDRTFLEKLLADAPHLLLAVCEPEFHDFSWLGIRLFCLLTEQGLLPDEMRPRFVDALKMLAIDDLDPQFLSNDRVRVALSPEEVAEILMAVRIRLLPVLREVVSDRIFDADESSPQDELGPLLDALHIFEAAFAPEPEPLEETLRAIRDVESYIEEHPPKKRKPDDTMTFQPARLAIGETGSRSVFDDVDE